MKQIFLRLQMILLLAFPLLSAGEITILFPKTGNICFEGEFCPIVWKSTFKGPICIESAIGGHDTGILNDCATPASRGFYLWYIPKGYVTYFGIPGSDDVRVVLYPKGSDHLTFSQEFTVQGRPQQGHPIFLKE